jgi:zinc D-Ala-D-Ala carboxypeptidase
MKLSKHLTLAEVIKSQTAIQKGIDNTPTYEHLENLKLIANRVFEPVRAHFNVPIAVSSGYRSNLLNKAVGGSKTSQHCSGEALDLDADIFGKITNKEIFDYIKDNLEFCQLINEFGYQWIHVSYSKNNNKKQVLNAVKKNGKTIYIPYEK